MGPPLIPGLAEELVAAAGRLHRRRRRRLRAAAAGSLAVVFVAAMAVTSVLDAPPASAGVEITERDGRVEVRLVDVETRPQVVEDALEDADIDADVVAVPASPSFVGRFVSLVGVGTGADIVPIDGDGVSAIGFTVPAGFGGHLELTLGRPAEAGEAYAVVGNALSVGEPLACLDLLGRPIRDLAAVAADHPELAVTVRLLGPEVPAAEIPAAEAATGPYADWVLVDASPPSPDAVLFTATIDGQPATPVPPPAPIGCD